MSFPVSQAPYSQALITGAALAYSGTWAFWQNQFSICALNTAGGLTSFPTGLSKPPYPPHRPGQGPVIQGDCWQSVVGIAASNGTPKWLVATGAPSVCELEGLSVWKWELNSWRWKGLIPYRISRLGTPRLNGDEAYAPLPGTIDPPWAVFDLNTMSLIEEIHGVIPPDDKQLDINGQEWFLTRIDAQNYTASPEQSPTLPTYCPLDPVNRQQMAVFLLKTKYGANYQPPPATGTVFSDVPASNPFAAWIEQLAREQITAGQNPCHGPA